MDPLELFLLYTGRLDAAGLSYMATGSVACMLYGIPRFTHDLDLVLELPPEQARAFSALFPPAEFYCPPDEVIRIEANRPSRGHFNLIHHETGLKADIYLHQADELQTWGLTHRRRLDIPPSQGLWIAPPEYVILRKIEYFREGRSEKHLADIKGMFEISGGMIQRQVLLDWAAKRNTLAELAFVLPPLSPSPA